MLENVDWGATILTLIVAILGNSVIVRVYFENKFNKRQQKHEKELSNIKAQLESNTYVTNLQYEREFKAIQVIWNSYIDCRTYFVNVGSSVNKDIYLKLEAKILQFADELGKNRPLIDEQIYNALINLFAEYSVSLDSIYTSIKSKKCICNLITNLDKKLMPLEEETANVIRNYLNSLKVK